MRFPKTTLASLISATIKAFLLGSVVITMTAMSAQADPLDKSSPKIAHGRYKYLSQLSSGMYRDRGKSSPKIAHGMYRDRGKSSPKIAHGIRTDIGGHLQVQSSGMYRDRGKSSPKIAHGIRTDIGGHLQVQSTGMYRDRGKSSPKIAHGMHRVERNELRDEIEMAIETGRLNLADELLYKLDHLNRAGR